MKNRWLLHGGRTNWSLSMDTATSSMLWIFPALSFPIAPLVTHYGANTQPLPQSHSPSREGDTLFQMRKQTTPWPGRDGAQGGTALSLRFVRRWRPGWASNSVFKGRRGRGSGHPRKRGQCERRLRGVKQLGCVGNHKSLWRLWVRLWVKGTQAGRWEGRCCGTGCLPQPIRKDHLTFPHLLVLCPLLSIQASL